MGLTYSSCSKKGLNDLFNVKKTSERDLVIALAGNPNTGKSTVFNSLTGLHQHTGNWPGKTVTNSQGTYNFKGEKHILVDLPGTYSLLASSMEEIIARDFVCFGRPNVTVVVLDATSLERNLNLLFQILEITPHVIACLNLMDEAKKKHINIDVDKLENKLGIPVIPTIARNNKGLKCLKEKIFDLAMGEIKTNPIKIKYEDKIETFIEKNTTDLKRIFGNSVNPRWLALRLLDGDSSIMNSMSKYLNINKNIETIIKGR